MFRILIVLLVGIVLGFALQRVLHIRQVETSAHYTSVMGVCLPSILSSTGNKRYMPIAIFHGLCLEISVPMLVTFFCSVNL